MAAAPRRVDTDALRSLVPIATVLRSVGFDVHKGKGRTKCPVHGGENRQALSYNATRWHCFACGAGGDVFDLVMAVQGCDFREALAFVAKFAGLPSDGLPAIDRAESERWEKIARRRAALRRWRGERLRQFQNLVAALDRDAERLGVYYAAPTRRDGEELWAILAALHSDLDRAECMAALLAGDDERRWAGLWLAEQRGELLTPEDLR